MLGLFEGSLAIGCVGLVSMAGLQFGHGSMGHHAGGHGLDIGHGHVGDAGMGHAHIGHIGHAAHAIGHGVHAGHGEVAHAGHGDAESAGHTAAAGQGVKAPLWLIPSPITVFSLMIGFGIAGIVYGHLFRLPIEWTAGIAVANALVFERFLVRPYWEWIFRSASTPGTNLEGAVATRAIAVTSFNVRGRGLVRLTVDGQDRDVLARLIPGTPRGCVRKGDVLFVERADQDNSVLVSKPDTVANL